MLTGTDGRSSISSPDHTSQHSKLLASSSDLRLHLQLCTLWRRAQIVDGQYSTYTTINPESRLSDRHQGQTRTYVVHHGLCAAMEISRAIAVHTRDCERVRCFGGSRREDFDILEPTLVLDKQGSEAFVVHFADGQEFLYSFQRRKLGEFLLGEDVLLRCHAHLGYWRLCRAWYQGKVSKE